MIKKINGQKYKSTINGKITKEYRTWMNLITRLTNENQLNKFPKYGECSICDEWLNFDNFAEWHKENYYEIGNEKMCLDKDTLVKGNKIYSPNKCVYVPNSINILFTKSDKRRGNLPIGVYYEKSSQKFKSQLSYQEYRGGKKKRKNLGRFTTPEEAFYRYKFEKEKYIKEVANRYKDEIPSILYEAMHNYKVEMGD